MRLLKSVALGGIVSRFAFVGLLDYNQNVVVFKVSSPFSNSSSSSLSKHFTTREREREREREKKRKSFLVSFSSFVLFSSEADDVNDDDNERERERV